MIIPLPGFVVVGFVVVAVGPQTYSPLIGSNMQGGGITKLDVCGLDVVMRVVLLVVMGVILVVVMSVVLLTGKPMIETQT